MANGFASTLASIRGGGNTTPGVTLADQIMATRRARAKQEAEIKQGLMEQMRKQQKAELDAKKNAFEMQGKKQERLNNQLFSSARGLLTLAQQDPQAAAQRLQGKEELQRRLQVDPSSPNFMAQLQAAHDRYRAAVSEKIPEAGSVPERSTFVRADSKLGKRLGLDRNAEVKYEGQRLVPDRDSDGYNVTNIEYVGPENEVRSPFDEARVEDLNKEFDRLRQTRNSAQETARLTAGMSDLIVQGDVQTGTIQPAVTTLQGIAESTGVDLASYASGMGINLGDLSKKEEFDRLAKSLTINQFEKFKGNLNAKEVAIAEDSVAKLGKSKEGNIEALAAMRAAADIAQEYSNDLLFAKTAEEYERLRRQKEERGVEEFRALKEEYKKRLMENMDTETGEPKESGDSDKESQTSTGLSKEEAEAVLPENTTLGEQNEDGSWQVLGPDGSVMGNIVPEE